MSNSNLFGWDLLFKTIEKDLKAPQDILIALIHWYLTKNTPLRCYGVGDCSSGSLPDEGSELLPDQWNNNSSFKLRYYCDNKTYVLSANLTDDVLVINLLNCETKQVSTISIPLSETVKGIKGNIKTMIPDVSNLLDKIKNELIEPLFRGDKVGASTQTFGEAEYVEASTSERQQDPSSLLVGIGSEERRRGPEPGRSIEDDPLVIRRPPRNDQNIPFGNDPLRDIGRGDLDPFGRGGGMLFPSPGMPGAPLSGPPQFPGPGMPGRFPRPPPGARFDPFGPPGANYGNPQPDHFRPPDDNYDYYM